MKRTKQSTFARRERSEKSTGFAPVGGEDMTHTAKYTPGPWKAVPDKSRNMYTWNVEGAKGVVPTIARLSPIYACEEIESNAHLIAAAPAMYEALSSSTRWLCRVLPYLPDMVAKEVAKQNHANMAALAQAEGR